MGQNDPGLRPPKNADPFSPLVPALAVAGVFASLVLVLGYAGWTARAQQAPDRVEEQVELSVPTRS